MKHFNDFLIQLQTLDIKIIQKPIVNGDQSSTACYDLSHQNPFLSNHYKNEIKALRELALTDLLSLGIEQIGFQLKRLEEIKASFHSFWSKFYSLQCKGGQSNREYLLTNLDLEALFIIPEIPNQSHVTITHNFLFDLQDTIESREKVVQEFEQSVLQIVPLCKEPEKVTTKSIKLSEKAEPIFKEVAAIDFYDLLKDYFVPEEQLLLKDLLTLGTQVQQLLLFKGKGNQLADAFKQLFEANLIVGCSKAELIHWILLHFTYLDKGVIKHYSEKYLQDTIASNTKGCSSPIIDVRKKEGHFCIFPTQKNNRHSKI